MGYTDPEKQKKYQREWIAKRRADYFKDKECSEKDSTCSGGLELDHVNPADKWTHKVWSYSSEKREAELKKCQPLCSSHHYRKTAKDIREMRAKAHGTKDGYDKYHCRCNKCKKYQIESQDEYNVGLTPDQARDIK